MVYWENDPQNHRFYLSVEGIRAENIESTLLFVDFFQIIWFHTHKKCGANTSSVWSPKETLTAIMMFYRNTKIMIRSSDEDSDFDIVARVL